MGITVLVTGACAPAARSMIDALRGDSVRLLVCDCALDKRALSDVPTERCFCVHRSDDPEFVGDLVTLCAQHEVDVLVPMRSADQRAISRVHELFEGLGASIWLEPIPAFATRALARRVLRLNEPGRAKWLMATWMRRLSGFKRDHARPIL
jgi:hypothetical protein